MRKRQMAVVAAGLSVLTLAAVRFGGWAVVTVDTPPDYLVVGKPTEITFAVRQHAVTPRNDLTPSIEVRSGSKTITGMTWSLRRDGLYRSRFTIPSTGEWDITIRSGWMASYGKLLPIQAIDSGARAVAFNQPEHGRRLFAAKGCVTCHVHGDVPVDGQLQSFGPQLTERRFPAEYLARFLANPSIKPPTNGRNQMPNPQLNQLEIASIIAFINGEGRVATKR